MSPIPISVVLPLSAFGKRCAPEQKPPSVIPKSILKTTTHPVTSTLSPKHVQFSDVQTSPLPCVPVKSSGFFQGLTTIVKSASQACSAFFDSGAAVNIIKPSVLNKLSASSLREIQRYPPDINVSGISGKVVLPQSKVLLEVTLSPHEPSISDHFYVIDDVCFAADMLIGYHTMHRFNISLFPGIHQIAQNGTFISASPFPESPSPPNVSLVTSTSDPPSSPSQPADSLSEALLSDTTTPPTTTLSDILTTTEVKKAVLSTPVIVTQTDLSVVRVQVKNVPPGTDVICLPDSARVNGVALESVLTTIKEDGSCYIAIQNLSNHPISLHSGVVIGDVLPYPAPVTPIDSLPCHISTSSPLTSDSSSQQLDQHLNDVDFHESRPELLALLSAYRSCVSLPGEPLGKTDVVRHSIHLTPGSTPTYVPAYRIPHSRRTLMDDAVKDMLKEDIIEPAASPYNAPLFLVPKSNGEWRVVVDFRALNAQTVPDRFPMPVLSDLLQSIGDNNTVFSTLDLHSGFFQVELEESSRPYTAFTTSSGQFAFKRMAMGLRNSPLTFMRLMNSVLAGLIGTSVFCYIDDVILASKSITEHLDTLSDIMSRFAKAGLTLKLSKCQFLKREIKFLGHKVDKYGIHTLDDKIHAIKQFPTPTSVDDVRRFVGLAGFYRQFIKDFSKIAQPLTSLLKRNVEFIWSKDCENAFATLKQALCNAPVLAFPNFDKEFLLCTDASNIGIGSVLMQRDNNGKCRAIAYASRVLNKAERNYSVTHREALAVVWSLRHFRDIILGYKIHVLTDHFAVTELFKGTSLTGKFARWQLTVQEYNPTFAYIPGKANSVADALSRHVAPVTMLTTSQPLPTLEEIKSYQREDSFCSRLIYYLESGDASNLPNLPFSPDSFSLQDEVLYKSSTTNSEDTLPYHAFQLVIPAALVPTILYHIHDSPLAGHPGKDRSFRQAQRAYFWPSMRKDITRHCLLCPSCAEHRPSLHHESPNLAYPIPHAPWDSLSVDVLKLPLTENGFRYLLVCIDSFSRFSILVPLKDKTARSVARALINEVICRYASPKVLLSDNGTEFNNAILKAVCETFQIKKCNILPYAPQANGKVERANRRILDIIRFISGSTSSWDEHIPLVECSLNSAVHSSVNESPHFILYGSDKKLPYQFISSEPRPLYDVEDYVRQRVSVFQRIHTSVRNSLESSQHSMLAKQHQRAKPHEIGIGDIVFTRVQDRHSKLDPLFNGPHRVINVMSGHKVKLLNLKSGTEQIIHKDHLKRVNRGFDVDIASPLPSHAPCGVDSQPSTLSHAPRYQLRSRLA